MEAILIKDFKSIFKGLAHSRKLFHKINKEYDHLESAVDLLFQLIELISRVAKREDEERYALEVILVIFRRIVGSLSLLESGLSQEAQMLLRNAIEFMLIFIDITYNKQSLEEWKKTESEDLIKAYYEDWYFAKEKIEKRIKEDKNGIYPPLEKNLVTGTSGTNTWSLVKEWAKISNQSLHAHSQAQLRAFFNENGTFQILGLKDQEKYKKDFSVYARIFFDLTSLLMGIPKYAKLVHQQEDLKSRLVTFKTNYLTLKEKIGGVKFMEIKTLSKEELQEILYRENLVYDISDLPDDAEIEPNFDLPKSQNEPLQIKYSSKSFFKNNFEAVSRANGIRLGRNDLCWCGSGKKYKKCHLA